MLMVLRCEPHVASGYGPCIYMDSPKSVATGKDEMGDLMVTTIQRHENDPFFVFEGIPFYFFEKEVLQVFS